MKTTITMLLACLCLKSYSQKSFDVNFIKDPVIFTDTIKFTKGTFDYKRKTRVEVISPTSKYLLAHVDNKFFFIPYDQIKEDKKFTKWEVETNKVYSDDAYYLKVDDAKKVAYYQDIVNVDSSLKKAAIYKKVKQWSASILASNSIQLNYDSEQDGKIVFNLVQSLYIPQGFGTQPFDTKYTFTIDIKDGKYRYRVDNIEFGYSTIIGRIGKRETLYSQWISSDRGQYYDNDVKRILAFQKHLKMQTDLLKESMVGVDTKEIDF